MIEAAGGSLAVALRLLAIAATLGTLGAWIFSRFVVPVMPGPAGHVRRAEVAALAARAALWCAAILALAALPRLLAQASALADPGESPWPTAWNVLHTRWGLALAAQSIAAGGVAVLLAVRSNSERWPPFAEACAAVLAVVPAFLGHAGAAHEARLLSVVVDVAHVAAAAGWVGSLALLAAVVFSWRREPDGAALAAGLFVAFHPVALVACGTVFVTGLAGAWLRMGLPEGIASSTYSGLFVAKLLLATATGAIGAGHARRAMRRPQQVAPASIGRSLLSEVLLAALVLLVTAVLTGTAPIS